MAFPFVEGTNSRADNSSGGSYPINLPASIVAGELLIAALGIRVSVGATTWPAGWNKIVDLDGDAGHLAIAWREADGGEGASITVTSGGSGTRHSASVSYRFSAMEDPDTQPPQVTAVTGGFDDNPNPPNLTPTGGAKDYHWLAIGETSRTASVTTYPTSFTLNQLNPVATDQAMGAAGRNVNAASQNPGIYDFTLDGWWTAATVAIHPASIPVADLTGTVIGDTEADIRAGGSTIILTITNGTWAADGATFDAERQGIIDGLDSAQSESNGWDAKVVGEIDVEDVVRTSDTVVTITLPAVATYELESEETITATIPASAVDGASDPVVATPAVTIINATESDFPVVEATNTSSQGGSSTSHTVSLPAGIVAGDLLIVNFGHGALHGGVTFPAGWTNINEQDSGNSLCSSAIGYKPADGTEGSTITVTTVNGGVSSHISYRLSNARNPTLQAPEVASDQSPDGQADDSPDPPNVTPTGGAKDYLWLALGVSDSDDFTAAPASYSNLIEGGAGGNPKAAGAERELFASSENPGVFTLGNLDHWTSATVVIHPAFSIQAAAFLWGPRIQERVLLLE